MNEVATRSPARISPEPEHYTMRRKRFQSPLLEQPTMRLDEDGSILEISTTALRMLEHTQKSDALKSCFFSLVHGKNLYQVMRDVADMVCYGKSRASWLLRLETGMSRWRWYRVSARNNLSTPDPGILLTLEEVHEW